MGNVSQIICLSVMFLLWLTAMIAVTWQQTNIKASIKRKMLVLKSSNPKPDVKMELIYLQRISWNLFYLQIGLLGLLMWALMIFIA